MLRVERGAPRRGFLHRIRLPTGLHRSVVQLQKVCNLSLAVSVTALYRAPLISVFMKVGVQAMDGAAIDGHEKFTMKVVETPVLPGDGFDSPHRVVHHPIRSFVCADDADGSDTLDPFRLKLLYLFDLVDFGVET